MHPPMMPNRASKMMIAESAANTTHGVGSHLSTVTCLKNVSCFPLPLHPLHPPHPSHEGMVHEGMVHEGMVHEGIVHPVHDGMVHEGPWHPPQPKQQPRSGFGAGGGGGATSRNLPL